MNTECFKEITQWAESVIWKECKSHNKPYPILSFAKRRKSKHRVYVLDTTGLFVDKEGRRYKSVITSSVRVPEHTSGSMVPFKNEVRLNFGTDSIDAKGVVLHELAHWLVGAKERHNDIFYQKCFWLYEQYLGPHDMVEIVEREREYQPRVVNKLLPKERKGSYASN